MRAPALPEKDDGTWKRGDPVTLFDGKDLTAGSRRSRVSYRAGSSRRVFFPIFPAPEI